MPHVRGLRNITEGCFDISTNLFKYIEVSLRPTKSLKRLHRNVRHHDRPESSFHPIKQKQIVCREEICFWQHNSKATALFKQLVGSLEKQQTNFKVGVSVSAPPRKIQFREPAVFG